MRYALPRQFCQGDEDGLGGGVEGLDLEDAFDVAVEAEAAGAGGDADGGEALRLGFSTEGFDGGEGGARESEGADPGVAAGSFEDAIRTGIERANSTLRNVTGAWVKEQKVEVADGNIVAWQVVLEVTFILD